MKTVLGAWILVGVMGCGKTLCDQAVDKLNSCNLSSQTIVAAGCDTRSQCESQCILNASCSDISAAFAGTENSYSTCDHTCNK